MKFLARAAFAFLAVGVLLLSIPLVVGEPEDGSVEIARYRAGDTLRIDSRVRDGAAQGMIVVRAEGPARQMDAFGIERDAVTFVAESYRGSELQWAIRCHRLAGGREPIRTEVLAGEYAGGTSGSSSSWLLGSTTEERSHNVTTYFGQRGECSGDNAPPRRAYAPGDVVTLAELDEGTLPWGAEVRASPAERVEFHGRRAVSFSFSVSDLLPPGAPEAANLSGRLTIVIAHGLPTFARIMADFGEGLVMREIAGFAPGEGEPLPDGGDADLPLRNPDAAFARIEQAHLDDAAFALAYPFDEAVRDARANPQLGLAEWLGAHPAARVVEATFQPEASAEPGGTLPSEGAWTISWQDEGAGSFMLVASRDATAGGLGDAPPLVSFARSHHRGSVGDGPGLWRVEDLPMEILSSEDALALARAVAGLGEIKVYTLKATTLLESPSSFFLELSDVVSVPGERTEGTVVSIDLGTGGVRWIARGTATRSETGLLGGTQAAEAMSVPAPPARASILDAPAFGSGPRVTSVAAGIALIAVAAKLLVAPLYTRLVRARLLDNPTRSRVYERVRAEPGIRLHEIIEFAAIGEGAARRHVAQLSRHGFLVEIRDGALRSYYAAGEVPPDVARRAAILRSDAARRVYDLLAAEPNLTLRDAAARLGLSAPSVHRTKQRLQKAGLLPARADVGVELRA